MAERLRRYSPSAEKVVPEEADDQRVRANANLFVERLSNRSDRSTYGPNAFIPTPQAVREAYLETEAYFRTTPEGLFTLSEAYGAAKRMLLFLRELAYEEMERNGEVSSINMENIGQMYGLIVAIELALPVSERPKDEPE